MLDSVAYKTYLAYATGKKISKPKCVKNKADFESSPKKKTATTAKGKRLKTLAKAAKPATKKQPTKTSKAKGLTVLSEVSLTEAEQIKLATKRSLIETHSSHASGSGADEGTGSKPGVPDVPTYGSDDEQISWKSSDEEDDDEVGINDDDDANDDDEDNDDDDELSMQKVFGISGLGYIIYTAADGDVLHHRSLVISIDCLLLLIVGFGMVSTASCGFLVLASLVVCVLMFDGSNLVSTVRWLLVLPGEVFTSCISTRKPLLDDYKKGKKTTEGKIVGIYRFDDYKTTYAQMKKDETTRT
ncbi:hypothetical protein Tco_1533285 [Tanacetum coccineum]